MNDSHLKYVRFSPSLKKKNYTSPPEGSIQGILDLTNKEIIEILLGEVN